MLVHIRTDGEPRGTARALGVGHSGLGIGYWASGIGTGWHWIWELGGDTLTDHFHSLGGRCGCSSFIAIAINIIFTSSSQQSSTSSGDNSNSSKTIAT